MKKIDKKPIIILIILILFQTLLYLLSKTLQTNPHLLGNAIDEKIPFINIFIIPYASWYILLFLIPYLFYKTDKNIFTKYILCFLLTIIICNIIFIIYPTIVVRPIIQNTNIINVFVNIAYKIDTPALNCFPSIHCAVCMMWILYSLENKNLNKKYKVSIVIISILIMLSTLFIKQHVFIDLISGDILVLLIYLFLKNKVKTVNKFKKMLSI